MLIWPSLASLCGAIMLGKCFKLIVAVCPWPQSVVALLLACAVLGLGLQRAAPLHHGVSSTHLERSLWMGQDVCVWLMLFCLCKLCKHSQADIGRSLLCTAMAWVASGLVGLVGCRTCSSGRWLNQVAVKLRASAAQQRHVSPSKIADQSLRHTSSVNVKSGSDMCHISNAISG